jgi:hypothetical protein
MFYLNVAKVDLDVAYTCMLQAYVQVFLGVSYIYLQVFYLDVAYVCDGFQVCFRRFSQVFQTLVSSVSSFLFCMLQLLYLDVFCMLQLLYLDVSKVDRVLHM